MMNDDNDAAIAAMAIPDVFLSETHLAAARAVLAKVTSPGNVRLAFVSGSLAAGLGHGLSDVDLYVALADGVPALRSYPEGGCMVQVNPVSAAQLSQIAASCAAYTDTAASRRQIGQPDPDLKRAVRYAIGTILAERDAGLPGQDDSRRTIRRVLMNRYAYLLSDFAEDTLGAVRVGDWLTALQASLLCVEHGLECALAAAGDIYLGRKFQLRRLARTAATRRVLAAGLGHLRQPALPQSVPDELAGVVVARMLFASHLVASSLLGGWDEPLRQVTPPRDRRAGGGPVRSPWMTAVRFADSWGMAGADTGYRITPAMVRVWHALDGRTAAAVHREFAADPQLSAISRDQLDSAISKLTEKKAAMPASGPMW